MRDLAEAMQTTHPASFIAEFNHNHFHNILKLFDVLPNVAFITSETMGDYYLQTWCLRVASRVNEQLKT